MSKKKKIMIGAVILIAAILVFSAVFIFIQSGQKAAEETISGDIAVETPYGTLYYPGKWHGRVHAEVLQSETVTVSFYGRTSEGKETHLFDVIFGGSSEESIGTLRTAAGEICNVAISIFEPDPQVVFLEKDIHDVSLMQDDVNYLIARLPLEELGEVAEPEITLPAEPEPEPSAPADVVVETEFATISYPGELAEILHAELREEDPYGVTFYWDKDETRIPLYEITFGSGEGFVFGYLEESGKAVHLTVYDVAQNGKLTQEELETALSLQESLNDVLAKLPLRQDGQAESAYLSIETPYGSLCYPADHQQHLYVEPSEENGYKLSFLYVRDSGEMLRLFDVVFDGAEGTVIGRYTGEESGTVAVSLVTYSPAFDETWSEEEENRYYAMMEGINFLFGKYEEMYAFEFA